MVDEITAEIVRELLDYNAETGVFTWKERCVEFFQDGSHSAESRCASWNYRFAGKPSGCRDVNGYIQVSIFDRLYRAHRIAWLIETGEFPEDSIDHINGDRADNRWVNLRAVTPAENCLNKGMQKNNTSGFRGVTWHKTGRKWQARIWIMSGGERKGKYLGLFDTPEAAHAAYAAAAKQAGFTERHILGDVA